MDAVNNGVEEKLFNYIHHSITTTAYYQLLGLELMEMGSGYVEFWVKPAEKHTNPLGKVHGGLVMSIADAAMANSVRSLGINGVTCDCSVAFPGAARLGDLVTARGKVVKAGHNLVFAEAMVYANNKLIGQSKGTFYKIGDIEF